MNGKPEAAATIWPWRDRAANARRQIASIRRGALLRAVIAALAASLLFYFHRRVGAGIAGGVCAVTLALAILSPTRAYPALLGAMEKMGALVGMVLSWVLLTPVFFLFFVPFGLLFRRGRRDRLGRRFERERASYWITRPPEKPGSLERPY